MNFDLLCNIILEDKSFLKTRVAVANAAPVFSMDDVLRDPGDPSKGLRTYLDDDGSEETVDEERKARRALRRINWVAKSMIKRMGSRDMDIHKLLINIITILEKYLTNVMRYSEDQIEAADQKIAKEAGFIGKLLLPPSGAHPRSKGVLGPAESLDGGTVSGKQVKGREPIADRLMREFNMSVDEYLAAFDPDLIGTIKEIIRTGAVKKSGAEINTEEIPSGDMTPESTEDEEIATESVEDKPSVTAVDILKDPRIRNVYDSRIVRKVLRSMIEMGSIILNAENELELPEEGTEGWRKGIEGARERSALNNLKDIPTETEVQELEPTFDEEDPVEPVTVTPEDEEDEEDTGDVGDLAAQRLGYKKSKHGADEEVASEDEEDSDSWQK